MKKQVCKDCYYAGFDKCDHVKKDETEYLSQGKNGKKLKESISQLKTKVMKRIIIGKVLQRVACYFWIAENFYFGWNKTPQSNAEQMCDNIVIWLFIIGVILYFSPLTKEYEEYVETKNKN